MTRDEELYEELMRLPATQRRAIAFEILASCEADSVTDPAIEEAWAAELERRRRLIDSGEMRLIPWAEVRAELLADDAQDAEDSQSKPLRSAR